MIDIRLPNINAPTDVGQLAQIRSYLYQFAEQMNWALNTLESGTSENIVLPSQNGSQGSITSEANALATFSSIKDLIIKSADIVEAYYEEIDNLLKLSGEYVAQADFGEGGVATYIQETQQTINATPEYVQQNFYNKETIDSKMKDVENATKQQEGYIRYGNVGSIFDADALGIEIGEFDSLDENNDVRYARFTSYGLELFGESKDNPVAYVHQYKLVITNAEIKGTLKLGGYEISTTNGLSFKWIGR